MPGFFFFSCATPKSPVYDFDGKKWQKAVESEVISRCNDSSQVFTHPLQLCTSNVNHKNPLHGDLLEQCIDVSKCLKRAAVRLNHFSCCLRFASNMNKYKPYVGN